MKTADGIILMSKGRPYLIDYLLKFQKEEIMRKLREEFLSVLTRINQDPK